MSVAPACAAALSQWCNNNCPLYAEYGPLVALFDRHLLPTYPLAWRCYARHTLDKNATAYAAGKAYCTRPHIAHVLARCKEEQAGGEIILNSGGSVAVGVNNGGATTQMQQLSTIDDDTRSSADSHVDGSAEDSRIARRISIVVAHCREQLSWLADVHRGLHDGVAGGSNTALSLELHVYEKCEDKRSEGVWPQLDWQVST